MNIIKLHNNIRGARNMKIIKLHKYIRGAWNMNSIKLNGSWRFSKHRLLILIFAVAT